MAELIALNNLRAVLEDYGKAVAELYKANLARDDRPTTEDSLRNSIKTHLEVGDHSYIVEMDLKDYWKWLEHGTRGRQTGILNWIQIKPVIPRPMDGKKAPTPQQLAFLIGRKIREFGTQGKPSLEDAKATAWAEWRPRIEEALRTDMYDYVRKIMSA